MGPAVNAERQEAHAADRYKCERVGRGPGERPQAERSSCRKEGILGQTSAVG